MAAVSVISKQRQAGGTPYCVIFSRTKSPKSGLESEWPDRLMENSAGLSDAAVPRQPPEIGERALDHPAVDRAHEVVALRHRDEGHRQDELPARLAHAQQRLDARGAPGSRVASIGTIGW